MEDTKAGSLVVIVNIIIIIMYKLYFFVDFVFLFISHFSFLQTITVTCFQCKVKLRNQ